MALIITKKGLKKNIGRQIFHKHGKEPSVESVLRQYPEGRFYSETPSKERPIVDGDIVGYENKKGSILFFYCRDV